MPFNSTTSSLYQLIPKMALQLKTKKVCVVGGGAAGLVAAHELRKEGHEVVVFERESRLGGTWVYTPEVESDPLGLDPTRKVVHSSLYKSLRTNLPREIMGFRDFPFTSSVNGNTDSIRFPPHQEVLRYLEDFAHKFGLDKLIRYETEVKYVGLAADGKWVVKSRRMMGGDVDEGSEVNEVYDAVVVCNGHCTEPRIADNIPGIDLWPGKQVHSHNYRTPVPYKDQVVVLIGLSASAFDISRDIAGMAEEVHITTRADITGIFGKHPDYGNLWVHPMIARAHEDGRLSFHDGTEVHADVILHCTGYKYCFPFLDTGGAVSVDDSRVGPLYKHVFPPTLAPGLSFVGIPTFAIHFIVFELQSKWIAGVLSGRISLPSGEKMMEDIEAFYSELEAKGVPKRHTHQIHDYKNIVRSFEYEDWLAAQCNYPPTEEWRKRIFHAEIGRVFKQPQNSGEKRDDDRVVFSLPQMKADPNKTACM